MAHEDPHLRMPGRAQRAEFGPIRANLGREIVVKTPFPRSFMQMIFPTLSGAFPIINV